MQKPSRNAEAEWNAEVGQACGRCAGAEAAEALDARSVRENGSCGEIRKQAAKAVFRRCAGLFAGIGREGDPLQKRPLQPRSGFFQGRVSTKGSAFPGDWLRDGERPRLVKRNFRRGKQQQGVFCARLRRELWHASFVLR